MLALTTFISWVLQNDVFVNLTLFGKNKVIIKEKVNNTNESNSTIILERMVVCVCV